MGECGLHRTNVRFVGERPALPRLVCRRVSAFYQSHQALQDVSLDVRDSEVLALIGPSGCGKSTFLRCLNRMIEAIPGARWQGKVELDGEDILTLEVEVLRRRVGMVFQAPNPFPRSIIANIAYGLELHGLAVNSGELEARVEDSLRKVGLWQEVADRLGDNALELSLGQQQRLCIARIIALEPEVILMDEPCSALDPLATARIEDLISEIAPYSPVVIVTHNLHQARRIAHRVAVFHLGSLVESGRTAEVFIHPVDFRTQAFIEGRTG